MNKEELKQRMISIEKKDVADNVEKYQNYLAAEDIDEDAIKEAEDLSYRNASDEITDGIDRQIHENKEAMVDLAEVDFGPKTVVEPGAVVRIGGKNLVIATATQEFEWQGKSYLGVSVHSPIYPSIADKKSGDSFSFRGKEYSIESVE